jgi:hypothetical protein
MTEYHNERILTEVEKVVITLTGVFLDESLLLETNQQQQQQQQQESGDKNTAGGIGHDSDNEDEDIDTFDQPTNSSSRVSVRSKGSGGVAFGPRLLAWFAAVMDLLQLYSTCPTAMNRCFDKHCAEVCVVSCCFICIVALLILLSF